VPHLLLVNHIGFGKDGAASGNANRVLAFHSFGGKFIDTDSQPQCLMVQKAAGAGGAYRIHTEISHHCIAYNDNLAVLPADFQNCSYIRIKMGGGNGVSCDFIFNNVRSDDFPRQITGAAVVPAPPISQSAGISELISRINF
jgi:hypothetical protein